MNTNVIKLGKFNGAFAGFALNAYNSIFVCGVSKGAAHKMANDYASAIGRGISEDDEFASKVAKAKKNGDMKITGKLEATLNDDSAKILRVCQVLGTLKQEKLVTKYPTLDTDNLNPDLVNYLATCEAWAKAQTFDTIAHVHKIPSPEVEQPA